MGRGTEGRLEGELRSTGLRSGGISDILRQAKIAKKDIFYYA
jgi:hypothetical protein